METAHHGKSFNTALLVEDRSLFANEHATGFVQVNMPGFKAG